MPKAPSRPCATHRCPGRAKNGRYCAKCAKRAQKRRAPEKRASSAKRGYGANWRKIRAAHLKKHPLCVVCGEPATNVDHIIPLAKGGTNASSNLQSMCHSCHSRKTAKHDGGFGNARPGQTRKPNPQFEARERNTQNRGSTVCIRIVGAPATGKTSLGSQLSQRLDLPFFSIDHERSEFMQNYEKWVTEEQDLVTWVRLEDKMNACPVSIVETSGNHANDKVLYNGRSCFVILCQASQLTRRKRLEAREQGQYQLTTGYAYAHKLMRIPEPNIKPDFLYNSEQPIAEQLPILINELEQFIANDGQRIPTIA
jgi:5-methylcytosine-specific restriction protein A